MSPAAVTLAVLWASCPGAAVNQVLLADLAARVPGMSRELFLSAVDELRRSDWTADTSDGRHQRLTDEQRAVRTADGCVYMARRWTEAEVES